MIALATQFELYAELRPTRLYLQFWDGVPLNTLLLWWANSPLIELRHGVEQQIENFGELEYYV